MFELPLYPLTLYTTTGHEMVSSCLCVSCSIQAAGPQPSGAAQETEDWRGGARPLSELWQALQRRGSEGPEQTLPHQVLRL